MSDLAQQHPAEDGTAAALSNQQVQERLQHVPHWSIVDGKLTRDVKVKNFKEALALVNQVGELAERENHHPDICLHRWNHVRLEFYTHTLEGLSDNDFIMAAKLDQLLPG